MVWGGFREIITLLVKIEGFMQQYPPPKVQILV